MSTTKKNIQLAVFTCLILALGIYIGSQSSDLKISSGLGLSPSRKVNKILNIIQKKYVDKIAVDSLEDLAINEILTRLDPHSVYLPPIQAKNQNESLEGNFDGIGVEYYMIRDTLFVTHVRENGPSFKAGLLKGDKIIAVNGQKLGGTALLSENMVNKLRGKKGSEVNVSVLRRGLGNPKQFTIVRDRIIVSSIDAAFLMKANIGFIKIANFGSNTDEDFVNELSKLQSKGMQSLILDLRGNGGGYLNSATALSDQFLPDGKLIVYTKGLHEPRTDYFATEDGVFEKGKLIILIDEGTASASEIVAGAMQDLDRGIIIGRRSFGKGLVQEQFGFGDGSAINLTIARYYTPSGRSIQKSYRNGTAAYKNEISQRYERGEYTSLDSALKDSMFNSEVKTYKTSNGKVVYGGGGIMPDVFISLDTTNITSFYRAVSKKNLVPEYVYGTLVNNLNLKRYLTADEFVNKYTFGELDFKKFLVFCKTRNVSTTEKEVLLSKSLITKQITALLARFYFNEEGFYKVYNQDDNFVIKAIEKIKNPA